MQLYDTLLPEAVVPYISEMYVSDLLGLGGASADFGGQSNNRLVVNELGGIVPARFVKVADFDGTPATSLRHPRPRIWHDSDPAVDQ